MYILMDVIPITKYTGGSQRFADRRYYFLPVPAIQFVTRGFEWDEIKEGQIYDANVGDDKCSVAVEPLKKSVPATKITLRRVAAEGEAQRAVPLSRLLAQVLALDLSGVFVSLTFQEREKLKTLSEFPHEAIKTLISQT